MEDVRVGTRIQMLWLVAGHPGENEIPQRRLIRQEVAPHGEIEEGT